MLNQVAPTAHVNPFFLLLLFLYLITVAARSALHNHRTSYIGLTSFAFSQRALQMFHSLPAGVILVATGNIPYCTVI